RCRFLLGRRRGCRAGDPRAAPARFHGRAGRFSRTVSPGGRGGGPRGTPRRTAYRTRMKPAAVRAFFETLRAQNPAPRSELEYRNPFELLVAVILSAQATDASVN